MSASSITTYSAVGLACSSQLTMEAGLLYGCSGGSAVQRFATARGKRRAPNTGPP